MIHNKHQTWPVALEVSDNCYLCLMCPLDQRTEGRKVCLTTELCKECDGERTPML